MATKLQFEAVRDRYAAKAAPKATAKCAQVSRFKRHFVFIRMPNGNISENTAIMAAEIACEALPKQPHVKLFGTWHIDQASNFWRLEKDCTLFGAQRADPRAWRYSLGGLIKAPMPAFTSKGSISFCDYSGAKCDPIAEYDPDYGARDGFWWQIVLIEDVLGGVSNG